MDFRNKTRLLPLPLFDWLMKNFFGVDDTMKDFIGRKLYISVEMKSLRSIDVPVKNRGATPYIPFNFIKFVHLKKKVKTKNEFLQKPS